MNHQWLYVFVPLGVTILVTTLWQEHKQRMEKRTDLQKTEDLWWKLKDDPTTCDSEVHRAIGAKLDNMLIAELEEALRAVRTTSRLLSLGELSDEERNNRRKSQDTLEHIFRSWYDHRPKIKKFFDDRKGMRSIRRIYMIFEKTN